MRTITNDFHGTETTVRRDYLSPATVRRVRRTLCPSSSSGCTCGGFLGQRGPQDFEVEEYQDGSALLIVD